ncbi:MAG: metallophosphoesterase family protein [Planctomycetota bacterium]
MRSRTCLLLIALLPALIGCDSDRPEPRTAQPARPAEPVQPIQPFLQAAGQTGVTIRWTTDGPAECSVRYGRDELGRSLAAQPVGEPTAAGRLFEARLADLAPGTAYQYRVVCGRESHGGTFRTFPARPQPFAFIAYGDSRSSAANHRSVARRFNRHKPALIVHTGDMVTTGSFAEWPPAFFEPLADVIDHVPLFGARGNHEGNGESYRAFLRGRGAPTYYSFDYANAHFVCLDSCLGPEEHDAMLAWCAEDLAASNADWKIAFYHHPSYDVGSHRSRFGRDDLLPILRANGVDLVLCGHSHTYQRFHPMYTPGENDRHPIVHIVTAGGGAPLYRVEPTRFVACAEIAYHFVLVEVDGPALSARAIANDGRVIDRFELRKKDGRPVAVLLEKALPENDFDRE